MNEELLKTLFTSQGIVSHVPHTVRELQKGVRRRTVAPLGQKSPLLSILPTCRVASLQLLQGVQELVLRRRRASNLTLRCGGIGRRASRLGWVGAAAMAFAPRPSHRPTCDNT